MTDQREPGYIRRAGWWLLVGAASTLTGVILRSNQDGEFRRTALWVTVAVSTFCLAAIVLELGVGVYRSRRNRRP